MFLSKDRQGNLVAVGRTGRPGVRMAVNPHDTHTPPVDHHVKGVTFRSLLHEEVDSVSPSLHHHTLTGSEPHSHLLGIALPGPTLGLIDQVRNRLSSFNPPNEPRRCGLHEDLAAT